MGVRGFIVIVVRVLLFIKPLIFYEFCCINSVRPYLDKNKGGTWAYTIESDAGGGCVGAMKCYYKRPYFDSSIWILWRASSSVCFVSSNFDFNCWIDFNKTGIMDVYSIPKYPSPGLVSTTSG